MESISTQFSKIIKSKSLICVLLNSYFLGHRNSLCSAKTSKTLQITLQCSFNVQMKIKILSKYTIIVSFTMKSQKMLFIIVWKVAELLVIPKNITKGSKSLQFIQRVYTESCLLLIIEFYIDIVEFLAYIQLSEVLGTLKFSKKLRDQQEQVFVLDYEHIKILVVLYQIERAILFLYKKDYHSYRGFWKSYISSVEIFCNKHI